MNNKIIIPHYEIRNQHIWFRQVSFFYEFGTRLIVVLSFSIEYDMTIHLRSEVKDKKNIGRIKTIIGKKLKLDHGQI